eukprot:2541940-Karenia_brevis.AAC.1
MFVIWCLVCGHKAIILLIIAVRRPKIATSGCMSTPKPESRKTSDFACVCVAVPIALATSAM